MFVKGVLGQKIDYDIAVLYSKNAKAKCLNSFLFFIFGSKKG